MLLVNFLGDKSQIFNNTKEAIDIINKNNIHPDLLRIFSGEFNEIKYEDLLKINNMEIDINKMNKETNNIIQNIQNNLIDENYDNFLISGIAYPYGPVKDYFFLKNGLNPVLLISISFGNLKELKINTNKLRVLTIKSLESEWELLKVRQDKDTKERFIYGNCPAVPYSIFLTKSIEKLYV